MQGLRVGSQVSQFAEMRPAVSVQVLWCGSQVVVCHGLWGCKWINKIALVNACGWIICEFGVVVCLAFVFALALALAFQLIGRETADRFNVI